MHALELKIPPPLVAAILGLAMWGTSTLMPQLDSPGTPRVAIAVVLALIGFSIDIAGLVAFLRAKTTIHPMKPGTTSTLVTSGVYRLSRNPMYLGLLIILVAWAVYLSSVWAFAGPAAFIFYLNRFQIAPEERILAAKFGHAYSSYQQVVRRWV